MIELHVVDVFIALVIISIALWISHIVEKWK